MDIMADLVSAKCAKHLTVHIWISEMLGSVFYTMEAASEGNVLDNKSCFSGKRLCKDGITIRDRGERFLE